MPIVLQLKSSQNVQDLTDISNIISHVNRQYDYKIIGHEIQQLTSLMAKTTRTERVKAVSDFCAHNEIEYLSYHAPIFENAENIWDERFGKLIKDSILQTIEEAESVRTNSGIKHGVVIVCHITYYAPNNLKINAKQKLELQSRAEQTFLQSIESEDILRKKDVLAIENSYPKSYGAYAIAGPYRPSDITGLEKYGIKTVFDIAHYNLYANYVRHGNGNLMGDLDKEIHGSRPPSWNDCIDILSKSLALLHISDAKGFDPKDEGLNLGRGEIPIREILQRVNDLGRIIQGTIELTNGHLEHSKAQLQAAKWILENALEVLS